MQDTGDIKQVAAGFFQLGLYLRSKQWRNAEKSGLTSTQISILGFLNRRGPNRVMALAKLVGITEATASRAISTLERKGLVEKGADPDDGRATRISLTATGIRLMSRQSEFPEALMAALAGLDPIESTVLHRVLSKVILHLQETGAIEPQRMCCTCRFFRPYVHSDAVRPHHCEFVDAPFGSVSLRLDCGDHIPAEESVRQQRWQRFLAVKPLEQRATHPGEASDN